MFIIRQLLLSHNCDAISCMVLAGVSQTVVEEHVRMDQC